MYTELRKLFSWLDAIRGTIERQKITIGTWVFMYYVMLCLHSKHNIL